MSHSCACGLEIGRLRTVRQGAAGGGPNLPAGTAQQHGAGGAGRPFSAPQTPLPLADRAVRLRERQTNLFDFVVFVLFLRFVFESVRL